MIKNATVYSSYDGKIVTLIFNECIVMPDKNSHLEIVLPSDLNKWRFILKFDNDITKQLLSTTTRIDKGIVYKTFHHWEGDGKIELTAPELFESKDKRFQVYLKISTIATKQNNFRTVNVSLWQVNRQ